MSRYDSDIIDAEVEGSDETVEIMVWPSITWDIGICPRCMAGLGLEQLEDPQEIADDAAAEGWRYLPDGPNGQGNYCAACLKRIAEEAGS